MYSVLLRLIMVSNSESIEVNFDSRLSFEDNLKYLSKIDQRYISNDYHIFDKNKNMFISKKHPLNEMGIRSFMTFHLY